MRDANFSEAGEVTNTNEDVKNLIGKEPSRTTHRETYALEEYRWRGGLPTRSYVIYVVYDKREDGQLLLNNAWFNEDPSPELQSQEAWDALDGMLASDSSGDNTNDDVKTVIGKEPSRMTHEETYALEVYQWLARDPEGSRAIYVAYNKDEDGRLSLKYAWLNEKPSPELLGGVAPDSGPAEADDGAVEVSANADETGGPAEPDDAEATE